MQTLKIVAKTETIQEFLARGGEIKKLNTSKRGKVILKTGVKKEVQIKKIAA